MNHSLFSESINQINCRGAIFSPTKTLIFLFANTNESSRFVYQNQPPEPKSPTTMDDQRSRTSHRREEASMDRESALGHKAAVDEEYKRCRRKLKKIN